MNLEEQKYTIERALGERMMHHAITLMRGWATEVNLALYDARLQSMTENYDYIFSYYLSDNDTDRDELLNRLVGNAYRLADEIYADLRLNRGLSPELKEFDPNDPRSVCRYFGHCVHLQTDDLDWLRSNFESGENSVNTLMGIASMVENLQECFNEEAVSCLIDGIGAQNVVIGEQALATTILLLAQYDTRIDYFPELQEQFLSQIGDGEHAFEVLRALVNSTGSKLKDLVKNSRVFIDDLPDEIKALLNLNDDMSLDEQLNHIAGHIPDADSTQTVEQVLVLPDTWVFDAIVGEDEERQRIIEESYLKAGHMDLMWERLDDAEDILINRIRANKAKAADYLNLGHCCFIRGDRMMAHEYYKEAHKMYGSNTEFFRFFRPDRSMLVEKGVPLEQVYLMEDNLLS
ncbi:MAG: hypothetical protein J6W92_03270 [Paludibacteraceae bacterium]|nr:hypothetical protein [Paludibacteraceae bacterium]